MSDNDKQAFESHINVVCNKENDYEKFYAIWQAACEYKQKEIDELEADKNFEENNND